MASTVIQFKNGICGYAPQGSIGESGAEGYHIYYSPFNGNENGINHMIEDIKNNRVFSNNPEYKSTEKISYRSGDMIITTDSTVFIIDIIPGGAALKNIGKIKIISNAYEGEDIFGTIDEIIMKIQTSAGTTANNDYNYISNGNSPLYHHRDTSDQHVYGQYIKITSPSNLGTYINKMDGKFCKLIINFNSGLRFEKVLTSSNWSNNIFIDNRYFYPFGHSEKYYWTHTTPRVISSYEDEKTVNLKYNLCSDYAQTLCYGYLEFFHNNREYRKKINIAV
jgi:hypothetical protein